MSKMPKVVNCYIGEVQKMQPKKRPLDAYKRNLCELDLQMQRNFAQNKFFKTYVSFFIFLFSFSNVYCQNGGNFDSTLSDYVIISHSDLNSYYDSQSKDREMFTDTKSANVESKDTENFLKIVNSNISDNKDNKMSTRNSDESERNSADSSVADEQMVEFSSEFENISKDSLSDEMSIIPYTDMFQNENCCHNEQKNIQQNVTLYERQKAIENASFFEPSQDVFPLEKKFNDNISQYDNLVEQAIFEKNVDALKLSSFNGFPSQYRSAAWKLLLNPKKIHLLSRPVSYLHKEIDNILKDLPRLPKIELIFGEQYKNYFTLKLLNFLKKFIAVRPEIGYYQGLDNIAFELLVYLPKDDSFEDLRLEMFVTMIDEIYEHFVSDNFKNFDDFAAKTEDIIKLYRPDLYEKIDFDSFKCSILFDYYVTLFCRMDVGKAIRFLDVYCSYGNISLHFFALGILEYFSEKINENYLTVESRLLFIIDLKNNLVQTIDIDEVMKITKKYILNYQEEHIKPEEKGYFSVLGLFYSRLIGN
ncbi:TBC domain protein [Tubulinosema ratisbonensis]|uniref:TBC domain protein n=1 Tax=Tubulinosema ratisbonensis TaxID=291195 RepID=A0A437AHQ5_9MICR|nr:TBC domain protein [Tubulinosema ratisbonensis]